MIKLTLPLQTFIKRANKHIALEPAKRSQLQDGSSLTFGALKCRIQLDAAKFEVRLTIFGGPVNITLNPMNMLVETTSNCTTSVNPSDFGYEQHSTEI